VRFTSSCGIPDGSFSVSTLLDYPVYHYNDPADPAGTILHWYGQNVQDHAAESLQHDKAVVEEYIRSNHKLTSQLAFMKSQRKKKQPDKRLVEDYRFIISLYEMLKTMELKVCIFYILRTTICSSLIFKPPPRRHVSSKAILACLDVTHSWFCRAKRVIKLLNKVGPHPSITTRLQSNAATHKGSDLLNFLKQQDRTLNDHTFSP
jgi:hypothetical protein